ncbi:MAG: primosomal protein N' [Nitrospirae bacterium]|nr:primosomal protein N' [Nitrospirota bacterium]
MEQVNKYLDVVIGLGAEKSFTYSLPPHLAHRAVPGQRVVVPLGSRVRTGYIVGLTATKGEYDVKDILDIPDADPLVPPGLMELTRWVGAYYRAPWGMALGVALPPGLEEGVAVRPRKGVAEEPDGLFGEAHALSLNAEQVAAAGQVQAAVKEGSFRPFLLHGATGSGKTEVYLSAIEALKGSGRGAIVLVPEISLTPQLARRFKARFGAEVAVLHSGLTESKRREEWWRIRNGKASVAVGARSAVFAPFTEVGLIIVDEEHDGSYKQEEGVKYHARDVSVMRASMEKCPVVLGSATPSLESYYNAKKGKYTLLELPERVLGRPMPRVHIIDLKDKPGEYPITSVMAGAARERLERGEQALFFLNRRGFSDFLVCRDCGHVPECPSCSISLTFHKSARSLRCHWCGDEQTPPTLCPKCGGDKIKYMGGGTERIEKELEKLYDGVKITRVDRDTVKERGAYAKLLGEVASGESGILLGTQMVSKGHDLPGIGMVGVVLADTGLHHPDFRAAERTFQVVTQVAGRTGRGDTPGEVFVQTFQPEHYALTHAATHDYAGFYAEEIAFRKELGYPPFSRLALVILRAVKPENAEGGAMAAAREFLSAAKGTGVTVLGPAPAPVKRVRGKYRWFVILKGPSATRLHKALDVGIKSLNEKKLLPGCSLDVDVDPQGMV